MIETILRTKLTIPPLRPNLVPRLRLLERLNQGLHLGHKLTLISAPAGFGKTTLASEWVGGCERPVAWLSLEEADNDPTRFLTYLISALQSAAPTVGERALAALQSAQPPPGEVILTAVLNEITAVTAPFILVLDDYHLIDPGTFALTFLLEHLPPQMNLVIATREDPALPLARLRARGQLSELRAADLRFTAEEAASFLNQAMGLDLSAEAIAALDNRTEGWIAGLQLAAISMRGRKDTANFIQSFTGSHQFVLDYLMEEVLQQQPASVQNFLLRTAILERLSGPLCNAVTGEDNGQQTLAYLEQANLFIVPLDNERRWYRYHHLFADLLRQRMLQQQPENAADLHIRASVWYEANGLDMEAFQHAAAANDFERAARLVEGEGMPLLFRDTEAPVLNWLKTLPAAAFNARPSLWVLYASALTFAGDAGGAEEKLQAAEAALQEAVEDEKTRDLIGQMAAIRAMLAVPQSQTETIIAQSRRALEYLHPDNLPVRTTTTWTLGYAYQIEGDRAAAAQAHNEAISIGQASGNIMVTVAGATSLGQVQETENQLTQAAESYRLVLQLVGEPPWPAACAAYLGLARIFYEWNDLDTAQQHVEQSLQLAQQLGNVDTPAGCLVLLARLKLAREDADGASSTVAQAEQFIEQQFFMHRAPEVAAIQVLLLLHLGSVDTAAELAQRHDLPISQARVHLAKGDPAAALATLEPLRQEMEARGWHDDLLKVMVIQAVALHADGEEDKASRLLDDALTAAERGGFVRLFVDEGLPMLHLLSAAAARGIVPLYVRKLLAAFEAEEQQGADDSPLPPGAGPGIWPLVEPLTPREREVLALIVDGRTNPEIAAELVIAVTTVKTHVKNIYGKLQVTNRFQAIVRAKELTLF